MKNIPSKEPWASEYNVGTDVLYKIKSKIFISYSTQHISIYTVFRMFTKIMYLLEI